MLAVGEGVAGLAVGEGDAEAAVTRAVVLEGACRVAEDVASIPSEDAETTALALGLSSSDATSADLTLAELKPRPTTNAVIVPITIAVRIHSVLFMGSPSA